MLGCWWPPDLNDLRQPASMSRLDAALSEFLDDQVRTTLVPWPGGMAPPQPGPEPDEVEPPDVLAGLPPQAREAAQPCESALQRLLFEVKGLDPMTFAVAPLCLGAAALVASYVPARRAARISPLAALTR